jgi:hypothetical protein
MIFVAGRKVLEKKEGSRKVSKRPRITRENLREARRTTWSETAKPMSSKERHTHEGAPPRTEWRRRRSGDASSRIWPWRLGRAGTSAMDAAPAPQPPPASQFQAAISVFLLLPLPTRCCKQSFPLMLQSPWSR